MLLGPVVQSPIGGNPRLNFNLPLLFLYLRMRVLFITLEHKISIEPGRISETAPIHLDKETVGKFD